MAKLPKILWILSVVPQVVFARYRTNYISENQRRAAVKLILVHLTFRKNLFTTQINF